MNILRGRAGKQLILGAIIGVIVVGGVLGGVMVGRKMGGKANAAETAKEGKAEGENASVDEKSAGEAGDQAEAKGEEKSHGKGKEAAAHPQVVDLGEFLVNLRAGSAVHYLQAEVALSLSGLPEPKKGGHGGGAAAPTLPEAELAVVKDRVVTVLSGADFDLVRTTAGRQALKQQLLTALAKALPDYTVNEVLFTSFVTQ